jgi:hypothetical protein
LAATGEAAIRETSALPYTYETGSAGNPVSRIGVFKVPPNTPYVKGVVGPQTEGSFEYYGRKQYSGGGPQVVIDRTAKITSTGFSYSVSDPEP